MQGERTLPELTTTKNADEWRCSKFEVETQDLAVGYMYYFLLDRAHTGP